MDFSARTANLEQLPEEIKLKDEYIQRLLAERKCVEQALEESYGYLHSIVNTASDALIATNSVGNIVFWNHAAEIILGYSAPEIIGHPIERIWDTASKQTALDAFDRSLSGSGHVDYPTTELIGLRKEGRPFAAEVSCTRWFRKGERFLTIILRDVTARKLAESQQQQLLASLEEQNQVVTASHRKLQRTLKDLESAHEQLKQSQEQLIRSGKMAALGQLVSGVAHEVNNPLMGISGTIELMLSYVSDEDARQDLLTLQSSADQAISVVGNLLSFACKQKRRRQSVSANEIIERVIRLRSYELALAEIEIANELASDLPLVMADRNEVQQVFLNLIINAEHAVRNLKEERGRIAIRTQERDQRVWITVADNGSGIPENILDRIFEPFFTTKEVGEGTGLGLSICHGIITDNGGHISVDSREGEGTAFVIELPIAANPNHDLT